MVLRLFSGFGGDGCGGGNGDGDFFLSPISQRNNVMASSCFLWYLFNLAHGDKYLLYHWGTSPVLVYWFTDFLIYLSLSTLKLSALPCHCPIEVWPVPVWTGGFYGHYFGTFFLHPSEYLRHRLSVLSPLRWLLVFLGSLHLHSIHVDSLCFPTSVSGVLRCCFCAGSFSRDALSHQKLSSVCTVVVLEKGKGVPDVFLLSLLSLPTDSLMHVGIL